MNFFVVSARSFTGLKSSRSSGCIYHFLISCLWRSIITSHRKLGDFQCWHATKPCHLTSVLRRYGVWPALNRLEMEPGVTSQESVGYLVVICTTIFRCQLVSSGMRWSTRKAHHLFPCCVRYTWSTSRGRDWAVTVATAADSVFGFLFKEEQIPPAKQKQLGWANTS